MAITRSTTETRTLATVDVDDYGNVAVTLLRGDQILSPTEARTLAGELISASITADLYRLEQTNQAGASA